MYPAFHSTKCLNLGNFPEKSSRKSRTFESGFLRSPHWAMLPGSWLYATPSYMALYPKWKVACSPSKSLQCISFWSSGGIGSSSAATAVSIESGIGSCARAGVGCSRKAANASAAMAARFRVSSRQTLDIGISGCTVGDVEEVVLSRLQAERCPSSQVEDLKTADHRTAAGPTRCGTSSTG